MGARPNRNDITDEERLRAAAKVERRALSWIEHNPDAWRYMTQLALHETHSCRRFGSKWLIEQARSKDFSDIRGCPTKIDNSLSSAFARILVAQMPEAAPFIELRRSQFEEVR